MVDSALAVQAAWVRSLVREVLHAVQCGQKQTNKQTTEQNKPALLYRASSLHDYRESERGSGPDSVSILQPMLLPLVIILTSQGGYRAWRDHVRGQRSTWHVRTRSMPSSFFL